MEVVARQNAGDIYRIYAHRNITLDGSSVAITGAERNQFGQHSSSFFRQNQFRYRGSIAKNLNDSIIYDIYTSENNYSTKQLDSIRSFDINNEDGRALISRELSNPSPLRRIERVLSSAGLLLSFSFSDSGEIIASRNGHMTYGIDELSDGERSAFLLAASVITQKKDSLILIDEPERHLHRSISSPLIHALLSERPDCAFVVATHDIDLLLDQPTCSALLMREYRHSPQAWDTNYIARVDGIDENLSKSILGSRRNILFVEGESNSLDFSLYSIVFKNVSVVPQSSCVYVINATRGINETLDRHWIRAVGVIDRDRRRQEDIDRLQIHGVVAINVHSVENIYFYPRIINSVSQVLVGTGAIERVVSIDDAKDLIIRKYSEAQNALVGDATSRRVREAILSKLPKPNHSWAESFPSAGLNSDEVENIYRNEVSHFDEMLCRKDAEALIAGYPIKRTGIPKAISDLLGLKGPSYYNGMVRRLAITSPEMIELIRDIVGPLSAKMDALHD